MVDLVLSGTFTGSEGASFTSLNGPTVSADGLLMADVHAEAITMFARPARGATFTAVEVNLAAGNDGFGNLIPLTGFHDAAFDPAGDTLYVSGSGLDDRSTLAVFRIQDEGRATFVETTGLPAAGPFGDGPASMFSSFTLSPDGRHIYAPVSNGPDAIAMFDRDPGSGRITYQSAIAAPDGTDFTTFHRLSVSDDGSRLAVAALGEVVVYDRNPTTGALSLDTRITNGQLDSNREPIEGMSDPEDVVFGPGGQLYVASPDDNAVLVMWAQDGAVDVVEVNRDGFDDGFGHMIAGLRGSTIPDMLFVSHSDAYVVANSGTLFAIDQPTGRLTFIETEESGGPYGMSTYAAMIPGEDTVVTSRGNVYTIEGGVASQPPTPAPTLPPATTPTPTPSPTPTPTPSPTPTPTSPSGAGLSDPYTALGYLMLGEAPAAEGPIREVADAGGSLRDAAEATLEDPSFLSQFTFGSTLDQKIEVITVLNMGLARESLAEKMAAHFFSYNLTEGGASPAVLFVRVVDYLINDAVRDPIFDPAAAAVRGVGTSPFGISDGPMATVDMVGVVDSGGDPVS